MDRQWQTAWSVGRLLSLRWPYRDEGMPPTVLAALERGVEVHRACEAWDLGQGYTPSLEIEPYLEAWKSYCRAHTPSWAEDGIEHRFDSNAGFHGVIDRVGNIHGVDTCLEIKSSRRGGPSHPRTAIQLAAYTLAYYGKVRAPRIKRLEVQLCDGAYRIFTHSQLADFLVVQELLQEAGICETTHWL